MTLVAPRKERTSQRERPYHPKQRMNLIALLFSFRIENACLNSPAL